MSEKSKQFFKGSALFIYYFIIMIFYTLSVSLYKNMKKAKTYAFNPEEKNKIKRELESQKRLDILNDRVKRVERLLYAVYEDPNYAQSERGKSDLKELHKDTK